MTPHAAANFITAYSYFAIPVQIAAAMLYYYLRMNPGTRARQVADFIETNPGGVVSLTLCMYIAFILACGLHHHVLARGAAASVMVFVDVQMAAVSVATVALQTIGAAVFHFRRAA